MNRDDLYYESARLRSAEQEGRRQHFDTMATAILAIGGALIGAMAFLVPTSKFIGWSFYPAILALGSFVLLATNAIGELLPRGWEVNPPLDILYEHMKSGNYEDEALTIWTAKQMSSAITNNNSLLDRKAKLLRIVYVSFAFETFMLGILIFSVCF